MAAIGPLASFVTANAGAPAGSVANAAMNAAKDMLGQTAKAASQVPVPAAPSLEAVLAAILTVTNGKEGLASLLSDLQSLVAKQPGVPANVRDSANALLAMQADASNARVDAGTIKLALAHSGVTPQNGGNDLKSALINLRDTLRNWEGGAPVQQLIDKADSAIARHDLLQVASFTDQQPDKPMRLVFDIPLLTPQGPAITQMAIERDGRENSDDDPEQKTWRASFSINLDPLGPVHASIAMQGGRAAVTLLAERSDAAKQLREGLPYLQAAFGEANLEPGELECREGAPVRATNPGILMDRAT